ncbi:nucleoside transporter 3, putative [Plasmodium knowlesi strain H]|uniref:Nucleoside transporter 3, putative n=3 Tax=Plasmodium knowlesi TaxID=5850 RepID=A0A5K1U5Z4_PLAKH|nr:nucleoside transporter 3, putative [Plasmodium knowlesi strain H]OTN65670.1 putative Nucleoside transporter 3 [Plasmodium knowlesi]CAA9989442.1 nucleoside transporter 3, putative [Plasmodium knowlesi strain H]SBO25071.1 nucleoside transporter 3, putative [Plasmodium knowlesi strain H]SBO27831.1 nucleoside transporter 3, putative [Plasmodium knowlesi strain H]VVS78916.1 nucleoside transporter 3, putative [Plasmodium knowlesi strain H]|eukprot:XP_002260168.1 hypothetical protein, conserved in Plasmodium species [Plasmodium knowlesi strain H]
MQEFALNKKEVGLSKPSGVDEDAKRDKRMRVADMCEMKKKSIEDIEGLGEYDIDKKDELEEESYYKLLSIAYALVAIISDAPYFLIVSMGDYFRQAFNVKDILITEFALMESIVFIVVCVFLHLIGSYRLKWNLFQPLLSTLFLTLIYLVVCFKTDYIGHKIVIFSVIPFAIIACVIKMTTMKICVLFRKQYCTAYVCGLSLSGFVVFILYVLGAYVFFADDENKFRKMFSLFCGVFSCIALTAFFILQKIYKLPFVERLREKYEDKGFLINKTILVDSVKSISVVWEYVIIGFLANFIAFQIYPTVFPICIKSSKEMKGLLSGLLLFGDSSAHLLVHFLDSYFLKMNFCAFFFIKLVMIGFLPIFASLVIYHSSIFYNSYFLMGLSYAFGFCHGILSNSVFVKIPEVCRKRKKEQYLKLAPNIVFLAFVLGTMIGVITSKLHVILLTGR